MMNYRKWMIPLCFALGFVFAAEHASATVFTFDDEYYFSASGQSAFNTRYGSANSAQYHGVGVYQATNTATPTISRLTSTASVNIPGEYVPNTSPNANQFLALFGWGQSLNNGQQVANVYNVTNPLNGSVLYFRYTVGGATTPFTFNSFDLRGSTSTASLSFTLQGYLNGVLVDSDQITISGNTFSTFTENWQNVDTVLLASTAATPANWGSGTLYMDNVKLNESVPTPEPATVVIWSLLGGLGFVYGWRRNRAKA
jgi:hypothetical protein